MLAVSEYMFLFHAVLDEVDSQFALLTAALEKWHIEQVLERAQVRVHSSGVSSLNRTNYV